MFVYNKDNKTGGIAMKLLNKQIDMISWTSKEGVVTPVRFRIEEGGKSIVIRIGRILQSEKNMFGGTPTPVSYPHLDVYKRQQPLRQQ